MSRNLYSETSEAYHLSGNAHSIHTVEEVFAIEEDSMPDMLGFSFYPDMPKVKLKRHRGKHCKPSNVDTAD